jgi:hypothetical protein
MAGLAVALALASGAFLAAAHLEEDDAFCASCHSEPESTYFERTQTEHVDLASAHHAENVRCIDCHSGPGMTGRVGALLLGAADLAKWVAGQAAQPALLLQPIPDANCIKCHSAVAQTRKFTEHFHAFLSQWQTTDAAADTCVSCHSAHTTDGSVEIGFLERERTLNVCQHCHSAAGEG